VKPLNIFQPHYGLVDGMIFITLSKSRIKPTKESAAKARKLEEQMVKEGCKILGWYWTLGRYDFVVVTEAKDEKTLMKSLLRFSDLISTETLVAVPREEALKLIE